MSASFPRAARLYGAATFAATLTHKPNARGKQFRVYAKPNQASQARLGIVVSKRIEPCAVDRNRCRRVIREVFRNLRESLPDADVVVRLETKMWKDRAAVRADLQDTLARAVALLASPKKQ